MAIRCGVPADDGVSDFLKVKITQNIGGQDVHVVGYLSDSCEMALNSVWGSPFVGDSLGDVSKVEKTAAIAQSATEKTSKTKWNSQQVWDGIEPPEVTLQIRFFAYTDARKEVDLPIMYLLQMASPELMETLPADMDGNVGRIPAVAIFDIGRTRKLPMRISNVSYDMNAPKTKDGYFATNVVSVTASPKQIFNRSEIPSYWQ